MTEFLYVKYTSNLFLREGNFQTGNTLAVMLTLASVMLIDFMCAVSSFWIKSSLSSQTRNRVLFTKNVIHPFWPKIFDAERK